MLYKVAVHGVTIRCSIQLHPVRHDVDGVVTLLQENDVRYNLCILTDISNLCGVLLEAVHNISK